MFTLKMKTDNAAFDGTLWAEEVARILRDTAKCVEQQQARHGVLRDINGNRVGEFTFTRRGDAD